MSNKLPVLTNSPIISSKIQIESELFGKKSSDLKQIKSQEHQSNESIQIGDSIPKRTITSSIKKIETVVTTYEENYTWKIIAFVLFLLLAGGAYYYYVKIRKNKN